MPRLKVANTFYKFIMQHLLLPFFMENVKKLVLMTGWTSKLWILNMEIFIFGGSLEVHPSATWWITLALYGDMCLIFKKKGEHVGTQVLSLHHKHLAKNNISDTCIWRPSVNWNCTIIIPVNTKYNTKMNMNYYT